jgi:uncharacterized protein HemY
MNQLYLILFLVLGVAIATFAIQNSGEAVVKFIGWQFHSSLIVIVLISTVVGVIMAVLSAFRGRFVCGHDYGSRRSGLRTWSSSFGRVTRRTFRERSERPQ